MIGLRPNPLFLLGTIAIFRLGTYLALKQYDE
jgi:hypothetical protein